MRKDCGETKPYIWMPCSLIVLENEKEYFLSHVN